MSRVFLPLLIVVGMANQLTAQGLDDFYKLGPDSLIQEGVPQGKLTGPHIVKSEAYPGTRHTYWVYVPAQYDAATPASLMIFNDGQAFMNPEGSIRAQNVMDNLTFRREIPVMIGVFINPGRTPEQPEPTSNNWGDRDTNRPTEYNSLDDRYARVIIDELLPELSAHYNIASDPKRRGIGGASSGAIAAFTVAWERPDQFHKVLSIVGSFTNIRGGHAYTEKVRESNKKDIRVFFQDGRNDNRGQRRGGAYDEKWDWFKQNVRLVEAMTEKGYDINYSWGIGLHGTKQGGAMLPEMMRWLWRDHGTNTDPNDSVERAFNAAVAKTPLATAFEPTTVFEEKQNGYKVFRIPALVRCANGDLLAFCEARQGGDASQIDLVLKRSSDAGKTWSSLQVVQESDDYRNEVSGANVEITIGNPAPVVDLLDPKHPGRIWVPFTLENDRVFVISSDDHGHTWSPRREITQTVKKPGWGWYATGPVHSIQVQRGPHRGRIVVPCDHRIGEAGRDDGKLGAHAILSDDHGQTWRLGAIDDTYDDALNSNETTVVELNDGRLYFSTRDQNGQAPGTRGEAWSSDAGATFDPSGDPAWSFFRPAAEIIDPPVVQCCLLRAASKLDGDSQDLLLFSGPDDNGPSGQGRSDMRVRYAVDEAKTWHDGPLIHVGPAAYSDMVRIDPQTIGILFEAGDPGQKNAYARIVFTAISLTDIVK